MRLATMIVGLAALALSVSAQAQSVLESGFAGALRGCEQWVLNPASWADGPAPFIAAVGLGNQMMQLRSVGDASLPPAEWRVANYFWRINSTENAGYILVVSSQLPICHITGGGGSDLQPAIEAVLRSSDFESRWEKLNDTSQDELISTLYRNREEPTFTLRITRTAEPGQRQDRVQLVASAVYDPSR